MRALFAAIISMFFKTEQVDPVHLQVPEGLNADLEAARARRAEENRIAIADGMAQHLETFERRTQELIQQHVNTIRNARRQEKLAQEALENLDRLRAYTKVSPLPLIAELGWRYDIECAFAAAMDRRPTDEEWQRLTKVPEDFVVPPKGENVPAV